MNVASYFQLGQSVRHRPPRDMKSAGQLGRGPLLGQPGQVVQYRKMRQLHPTRQRLGHQIAGQLVGHEQLAKQSDGNILVPLGHDGPLNFRS